MPGSTTPSCGLAAALDAAQAGDAALGGTPAVLRLAHGTYDLAGATWELNASTSASEIRLIGDGNVTINAMVADGAPLFRLAAGAPRLRLESLTLRGRIHVDGGVLSARDVTFEGGATDGSGGALELSAARWTCRTRPSSATARRSTAAPRSSPAATPACACRSRATPRAAAARCS